MAMTLTFTMMTKVDLFIEYNSLGQFMHLCQQVTFHSFSFFDTYGSGICVHYFFVPFIELPDLPRIVLFAQCRVNADRTFQRHI